MSPCTEQSVVPRFMTQRDQNVKQQLSQSTCCFVKGGCSMETNSTLAPLKAPEPWGAQPHAATRCKDLCLGYSREQLIKFMNRNPNNATKKIKMSFL